LTSPTIAIKSTVRLQLNAKTIYINKPSATSTILNMALEAPKFRYSTDAIMTSDEAKKFPWEKPIPVNSFWDSFPYCHARSVLHNFEVDNETLRIDPESTDDHLTKSLLLIQLLQDKLARAEAAAPPPGSLHDSNYKKWYPIWQGIYALQEGAGLPDAESTVRMLVATRPVEGLEDNVVPPHMLAELLVKREQYEEAEEVEKPVLAWIDAKPHLGRESPQAINARRFIAKALWFQVRFSF